WWALIGMFLHGAARLSYEQLRVRQALKGESIQTVMATELVVVPQNTLLSDFVENYVYRHQHKLFPIQDAENNFAGCIHFRALKNVPRPSWAAKTVRDIAGHCDESMTT